MVTNVTEQQNTELKPKFMIHVFFPKTLTLN